MALFRPPDVEQVVARGNIEGLIRAAKYKKSEKIREEARAALADMADYLIGELRTKNIRRLGIVREALMLAGQPAVDRMIWVHTDKQSVHRREDVTFVLGEMRAKEAVPVLIIALRDTDAMLRRLAAEALGKIGDPRAAAPLRVALGDDNAIVQKVATRALHKVQS
jgi:HEAT repeat protein